MPDFNQQWRIIIIATVAAVAAGALSSRTQADDAPVPALPPVPAQGMVVYKLHRQADEFAPCVEYSSIKMFATVANMITTSNRYLSVQQGQLAYHIDYPSPNEELLSDSDIKQLRNRIKEYETVSKRFKYSAPLLAPWIARFQQEIEMLNQGYGRAEGRWVVRASYGYERERARLRKNFETRKAEILSKRKSGTSVKDSPLWASAMEAQLLAEQAAFRKAFKKRTVAARLARTEEFRRSAEPKLTRKTESKLSHGKLDADKALDTDTDLQNRGRLGR